MERCERRRQSMTAHSRDALAAPAQAAPLTRRGALKAGAAGLAALLTMSHITPALAHELARLAHHQPMTGARLATILQAERSRWSALLAQVGLERMEGPGVEGNWSVKQVGAHLMWYEHSIVERSQHVLPTRTFTRRRPAG